MNCVIPGCNVKVFGRIIHTLCRIGDELYMQCERDGALLLRTVNMSRSAFALVRLERSFFTQLSSSAGAAGETAAATAHSTRCHGDNAKDVTCKVLLKACLFPFRSLATLDKSVEFCRLCADSGANQLTIYLDCRHKVNKTFTVPFIISDNVQAVYSTDGALCQLQTDARLLHESMQNFQSGQEEITLVVGADYVLINNYVDDEPDPVRSIQTALRLSACDFEVFSVKNKNSAAANIDGASAARDFSSCDIDGARDGGVAVTFCLREFRAVLSLAEPLRQPVHISFDRAGKPIVFCVRNGDNMEAHFVLATLAERAGVSAANESGGAQAANRSSRQLAATSCSFSDSIDESAFDEIASPVYPTSTRQAQSTAPTVNSTKTQPEPSSGAVVNHTVSGVSTGHAATSPAQPCDGVSLNEIGVSAAADPANPAMSSVSSCQLHLSPSTRNSTLPTAPKLSPTGRSPLLPGASDATMATPKRHSRTSLFSASCTTARSSPASATSATNRPRLPAVVTPSAPNTPPPPPPPSAHSPRQASDVATPVARSKIFTTNIMSSGGGGGGGLSRLTKTDRPSITGTVDNSALAVSSCFTEFPTDVANVVAEQQQQQQQSLTSTPDRTVCGPARFSRFLFARCFVDSPSLVSTAAAAGDAGPPNRRVLAANSDSEEENDHEEGGVEKVEARVAR